MLVQCPHHGPHAGILVSPDLREALAAGRRVSKVREVIYNHDGERYQRICMSHAFATEHGVVEGREVDLPHRYPPWHEALVVACEKCMDLAIAV